MFFGHSKKMVPSLRRGLPLFFTVLASLLLFLLTLLLFTRSMLQDYSLQEVELRLNNYLQSRSKKPLSLGGSQQKSGGLYGLSFVRLIREDEQFLYAESGASTIDFKGLVNLDAHHSVVWISLSDVEEKGVWTVASRVLEDGIIVQAGMQTASAVNLYHNLRKIIFVFAIFASVLSAAIASICIRKGREPLRTAENDISSIISKKSDGLLIVQEKSDLTALYVLLNKLISQNRQLVTEMQDSLDNVAHDLRTPMTRLRSVAEYGLQADTKERLSGALSDCLEESERVLSMLGIMMSVAEAESGTMRLNKIDVQLWDSVTDVINLYEYVADEKDIRLSLDISSDIRINADKTRITQVWANIIDNAIKYGKAGGFVKVSAQLEGEMVSLFFQDNGMGISANELPRIWERLFRGDRSRSEQGLGLGLNYVRAVVEAHDGEVFATSTLGEAACFEVKLPLARISHEHFAKGLQVKEN